MDLKISRTATATSAARHKVALLGHQMSFVRSRLLASCQSARYKYQYDGTEQRVITLTESYWRMILKGRFKKGDINLWFSCHWLGRYDFKGSVYNMIYIG